MEMPVGLPRRLEYVRESLNTQEVYELLIREPNDLIEFLECASDDASWLAGHRKLVERFFEWLSLQFLNQQLLYGIAVSFQKIVHKHPAVLREIVPDDIALQIHEKTVQANSMLVAASSLYLYDLMSRECMEGGNRTLRLSKCNAVFFDAVVEYISTGQVSELWKHDANTILSIMYGAAGLEMSGLVEYCAEVFKRYITPDNVAELLKRSLTHGWYALAKHCVESINRMDVGITCSLTVAFKLEIEFYRYRFQAIDLFDILHLHVSRLVFHGDLLGDERFPYILRKASRLEALDLSDTQANDEFGLELSSTIEELDLSRCEWLEPVSLEKIIEQTPHLKILRLNCDLQLDYRSWVLLERLGSLEHLELGGCHQLADEDLLLIGRGCPRLRVLAIKECKSITDNAFLELARRLRFLIDLDVSNTSLGNQALITFVEQCRGLEIIRLASCKNIDDSGILKAVKIGLKLKRMYLTGCPISLGTINEILSTREHLEVIGG